MYQSGFIPYHATSTAVTDVADHIRSKINNSFVAAVFLDLSKAFESVDHSILMEKLNQYGVKCKELESFCSFLSERKQVTQIGDCMSKQIDELSYGVPKVLFWAPSYS